METGSTLYHPVKIITLSVILYLRGTTLYYIWGISNRWRSLYLQRQNTQQSFYNIVLQLLTVRIRKHTQLSFASLCMLHHTQLSFTSWCMGRYTTQLRFVVYLMHTQLSFASWCIISKIHNSASPRVVYFCVSDSRQLKNIIINTSN